MGSDALVEQGKGWQLRIRTHPGLGQPPLGKGFQCGLPAVPFSFHRSAAQSLVL